MIDPYRMVFVNLIAITLLFLGVLFYSYIYPKKKINLLILLILISIPPMLSLLRIGDYESGDFNIHIYRAMAFYDSLKEGIFLPSWAGELNATYGYPLFIFNYPLSYYFISFFHFLGSSFISSMKIYLGLIFFLSGIFMYQWIKELTNNKLAAFTSAVFYLFNPYHLIDVHFRAGIGESTVFVFAPLIFYAITNYFKKRKFLYLIILSLSVTLLFMSHALIAGVFAGLAAIYILFIGFSDKKALLYVFTALFFGVITSVYAWIPFIIYVSHTVQQKLLITKLTDFYPFHMLFYSPWRFGFLFQGPKGELALIIGYTQILILLTSVFLIIKKLVPKKVKPNLLFWTLAALFFLFLMNPISAFLWKYLSFLRALLPTGRFSLLIGFCISVVVSYFVLSLIKRKKGILSIYLLITITILSTLLNWGHRRVIPEITDETLRKSIPLSTSQGEGHFYANSKFVDLKNPWFSKVPQNHLEIIKGEGIITQVKRTSTLHSYNIYAKTSIILRENTLYFPGWSSKSNNKEIKIYPDNKGIINAKLPKGLHYFELIYSDIPMYKISKIISAVLFFSTLCVLLLLFLRLKFDKSKPSN